MAKLEKGDRVREVKTGRTGVITYLSQKPKVEDFTVYVKFDNQPSSSGARQRKLSQLVKE